MRRTAIVLNLADLKLDEAIFAAAAYAQRAADYLNQKAADLISRLPKL